jgi:GTP cyclohydrolase IA
VSESPQLRPIDLPAAEAAASALLDALGIDHAEGTLAGTPSRIARAYAELLTPRDFAMTTFPNDEGYDELVLVRDIPFVSVCEHHFMPFMGTAVVGYLPNERILGLSKLARVVELFARRPQVQERMTAQIAHWLDDNLSPKGVGIVLRADHTCMTTRGVRASGATTVTSTLLGHLRDDGRSRAEFMALARPH